MRSDIDMVGMTAFIIASWRARESERVDPLFMDHLAHLFVDEETMESANRIAGVSPSTRHLVMHRARFFDDFLLERAENGATQIVIMGSGLDTRSTRLGVEGVTFFEIDKEEVLAFKQEKLERFGYTNNSVFAPLDYTARDFLSALSERGFDPSRKTGFIWEGNTMYLKEKDILAVLKNIKEKVTDFRIAFDYLSKKLIDRSTGHRQAEDLVNGFAGMGAPWITGFDRIDPLAEEAGLGIVDDSLIVDMIKQHDPSFNVATSLLDDYSICTFANN